MTRSFFEKKKKSKYLFVHLRGKELYRFLLSSIKGTSTLLVIASKRTIVVERKIESQASRDKSSSWNLFRRKRSNRFSSFGVQFIEQLCGIVTFAKKISSRHLFTSIERNARLPIASNAVSALFRSCKSRNLELISGPEIQFDSKGWGNYLSARSDRPPFVTNRAAAREPTLQLAVFRGNRDRWCNYAKRAVWAAISFDFASCKSWKSCPFAAINPVSRFLLVASFEAKLLIYRQQFLTSSIEEL